MKYCLLKYILIYFFCMKFNGKNFNGQKVHCFTLWILKVKSLMVRKYIVLYSET